MIDKIEFKKLREFGDIINDTFQFVKQNFKPLLKVFIYFCGFFLLASMITGVLQQVNTMKSVINPAENPYLYFEKFFTINYLLLMVFSLLQYTALPVSILCFINLYVEKGNVAPTVEEVWGYFKYYFFRALGGSLLMSIFMGACFLCCLLPGIYVFPAVSLFLSVMIFENGSIGYSFNRSFKLLKDQWWVTAATFLVIWIIAYACMSFAAMPAMIFTMAGIFTQGIKGISMTGLVISTIIQYICQVFLIIPMVGSALIYFNLTERLENTGLMDRINQMGESKKAFDSDEQY